MRALLELIRQGGPAMIAIMALSVVLYGRCFLLILSLRGSPPPAAPATTRAALRSLRARQSVLQENFRRQRIALGAMIAAAPLLGLLGTVTGMERTFANLAIHGEKSMEGLAAGISQVLVATESGLAVAIPALLLVFLGHREVLKQVALLNRVDPPQARIATS